MTAGALLAAFFLVSSSLSAAAKPFFDEEPFRRHNPESTATVDYSEWAAFLSDYVRADADGIHRVDYAQVSDVETKRLAALVDEWSSLDPGALAKDEQMAFWINLYNAATVLTVLEHYPVDSIRDIALPPAGEGGGPWDAPRVTVLGRSLSLNDIEHRILRPIWNDERIHYAVNCAAVGCPNLVAVPFVGHHLEELLERAAETFINHRRAVHFERGQLRLSSLFDWYGQDFGADREELLKRMSSYASPPLDGQLER